MSSDMLYAVTQSIIAVLVVAGGGFAIITGNTHVTEITAFMGMVLGFFFGVQVPKPGANGSSSKSGGG